MQTRRVAVSLAGAAVVAAGLSAQVTQPRPGPGSGVVTVAGTVDIGKMPPVSVAQQGDWRVGIASMPPVVISPVPFLRAGTRYEITWSNGEREVVRVALVEPGGWLKVGDTVDRWVNLASVRSIALAP